MIEQEIKDRGIIRLCHFTRSSKALHILGSESGVIAVDFLDESIYDANDKLRLDGKREYINCSVQYPNYWYFKNVKDKEPLFKDWVVLFIKPEIILLDSTEFCFTNAAFRSGAYIEKGAEAFKGMFAHSVNGKWPRTRTEKMLPCCPTDDQAEVLVYKNISRKDIIGVAVETKEQAHREKTRWSCLKNIPEIDIIIAPDLFSSSCSEKIRNGIIPQEDKFMEVCNAGVQSGQS